VRLIRPISLVLLAAATMTAMSCGGGVGGNNGSGDDDDDGGTPTPSIVEISGTTLDYFTGSAVASALFGTEGLDPEVGGASDGGGLFSLAVPSNATFRLRVSGVSGYRATSGHEVVTESAGITDIEAPLVATADLARQYSALGLSATAGRGAAFLELWDPAGAPLEGIPLADIVLLDSADNPVAGTFGPYFFGTGGDLVDGATLSASAAFGGRARAGFLDVPPGDLHATVTWSSGGTVVVVPLPVRIPSDGVALRRMY
jgi:hypothetical protein